MRLCFKLASDAVLCRRIIYWGRMGMSGTDKSMAVRGLGFGHIAQRWGWFVGLGVALLTLGIVAFLDTVSVTLVSTIFIGAAMLVGGVALLVHGFAVRGSRHFWLQILGGLAYAVAGTLIMLEPVKGAFLLTVFVVISMVTGGVFRVVIAFGHRDVPGWWGLALGGAVSVLAGVLLISWLPWSSLIVLGTLVAVELMVHGITWLQLGLALRARHVARG